MANNGYCKSGRQTVGSSRYRSRVLFCSFAGHRADVTTFGHVVRRCQRLKAVPIPGRFRSIASGALRTLWRRGGP
jgi:hypothetical protein